MLVLTRKVHQKVVIDGGITVQVLEIRGDRVRLGFKAPESVVIDRKEVRDQKEADRDDRRQ